MQKQYFRKLSLSHEKSCSSPIYLFHLLCSKMAMKAPNYRWKYARKSKRKARALLPPWAPKKPDGIPGTPYLILDSPNYS
jgi:hypothetical protein